MAAFDVANRTGEAVQVSVEEPQVPSVHSFGDALVRVEDEAQRFMPSQVSVEEGVRFTISSVLVCKPLTCTVHAATHMPGPSA